MIFIIWIKRILIREKIVWLLSSLEIDNNEISY